MVDFKVEYRSSRCAQDDIGNRFHPLICYRCVHARDKGQGARDSDFTPVSEFVILCFNNLILNRKFSIS